MAASEDEEEADGTRGALRPGRGSRRPRPGAHPHALAIAADAPAPLIEWRSFTTETFTARTVHMVADLADARKVGASDWIDVQGFGDEDQLRALADLFGVHPLALADILNAPQRAKVDHFAEHDVVLLNTVSATGVAVDLRQVAIVVGPTWVLTFRDRASDVFQPVAERLATPGTMLRERGVDFLAHALIDAVVDAFFGVLDALDDALQELEEDAVTRPVPRTLTRIHGLRRTLLHLERAQRQQRDAILALTRTEDGAFGAAVRPYLQDVQDHVLHVFDEIETLRELSISVMDIYLSSVANRTNEIMSRLTVMATIFIPLTFIVGVYGMNFDVMPELRWRFGYAAAWVVMIVIAVALLIRFRRLGWLGADASAGRGADDGSDPDRS